MARRKGSKNKTTVGTSGQSTGPSHSVVPNFENYLFIDNLPSVMVKVQELITEKKQNPGAVQEDEAGVVFINGEPCIVIDNSYLPAKEAQLVLQTQRVVREYIKLQNLINNITE